jgi:4-hydroxy-3-methylbut-2-enyl diphosphate reductase IspH
MCPIIFHWYGDWQDSPRVERYQEPIYYQGQIVHYEDRVRRFERRFCLFCPASREREKKEIRLY